MAAISEDQVAAMTAEEFTAFAATDAGKQFTEDWCRSMNNSSESGTGWYMKEHYRVAQLVLEYGDINALDEHGFYNCWNVGPRTDRMRVIMQQKNPTRHFKVTFVTATGREFNYFYDTQTSTQALAAGASQAAYIANIVSAKVEEV